jgi:hypothetical protein
MGRSAKNPLSVLGVDCEDNGGVAVAAAAVGATGVLIVLGIGGASLKLGGAAG